MTKRGEGREDKKKEKKEKKYRKVIYYQTLVKKITTIPELNEFLQCHSNKSVLVGFINYAFQTWEFHLIKSVEKLVLIEASDKNESGEWMMNSFYLQRRLTRKIILLVYFKPQKTTTNENINTRE